MEKTSNNDEVSEDAQEEDSTNDEYDQDSNIPFDDRTESRSSFNQISDVFQGTMTPSLMPTGPDANHLLDRSSMCIVTLSLSTI